MSKFFHSIAKEIRSLDPPPQAASQTKRRAAPTLVAKYMANDGPQNQLLDQPAMYTRAPVKQNPGAFEHEHTTIYRQSELLTSAASPPDKSPYKTADQEDSVPKQRDAWTASSPYITERRNIRTNPTNLSLSNLSAYSATFPLPSPGQIPTSPTPSKVMKSTDNLRTNPTDVFVSKLAASSATSQLPNPGQTLNTGMSAPTRIEKSTDNLRKNRFRDAIADPPLPSPPVVSSAYSSPGSSTGRNHSLDQKLDSYAPQTSQSLHMNTIASISPTTNLTQRSFSPTVTSSTVSINSTNSTTTKNASYTNTVYNAPSVQKPLRKPLSVRKPVGSSNQQKQMSAGQNLLPLVGENDIAPPRIEGEKLSQSTIPDLDDPGTLPPTQQRTAPHDIIQHGRPTSNSISEKPRIQLHDGPPLQDEDSEVVSLLESKAKERIFLPKWDPTASAPSEQGSPKQTMREQQVLFPGMDSETLPSPEPDIAIQVTVQKQASSSIRYLGIEKPSKQIIEVHNTTQPAEHESFRNPDTAKPRVQTRNLGNDAPEVIGSDETEGNLVSEPWLFEKEVFVQSESPKSYPDTNHFIDERQFGGVWNPKSVMRKPIPRPKDHQEMMGEIQMNQAKGSMLNAGVGFATLPSTAPIMTTITTTTTVITHADGSQTVVDSPTPDQHIHTLRHLEATKEYMPVWHDARKVQPQTSLPNPVMLPYPVTDDAELQFREAHRRNTMEGSIPPQPNMDNKPRREPQHRSTMPFSLSIPQPTQQSTGLGSSRSQSPLTKSPETETPIRKSAADAFVLPSLSSHPQYTDIDMPKRQVVSPNSYTPYRPPRTHSSSLSMSSTSNLRPSNYDAHDTRANPVQSRPNSVPDFEKGRLLASGIPSLEAVYGKPTYESSGASFPRHQIEPDQPLLPPRRLFSSEDYLTSNDNSTTTSLPIYNEIGRSQTPDPGYYHSSNLPPIQPARPISSMSNTTVSTGYSPNSVPANRTRRNFSDSSSEMGTRAESTQQTRRFVSPPPPLSSYGLQSTPRSQADRQKRLLAVVQEINRSDEIVRKMKQEAVSRNSRH